MSFTQSHFSIFFNLCLIQGPNFAPCLIPQSLRTELHQSLQPKLPPVLISPVSLLALVSIAFSLVGLPVTWLRSYLWCIAGVSWTACSLPCHFPSRCQAGSRLSSGRAWVCKASRSWSKEALSIGSPCLGGRDTNHKVLFAVVLTHQLVSISWCRGPCFLPSFLPVPHEQPAPIQ